MSSSGDTHKSRPASGTGVVRFGLTGALTFAVLFFVYWLVLLLQVGFPRLMLYHALSNVGLLSLLALFQGLCWSLAIGLIAGVFVALVYGGIREAHVRGAFGFRKPITKGDKS